MAGEIDVGGIIADLQLDSSHLERGLANARKAMDLAERELKRLQKEFDGGQISATSFGQRADALRKTIDTLSEGMVYAYTATKQLDTGLDIVAAGATKITVSAGHASRGVAGMGQSMLQSGRIIQDFAQGGLPGILNNIEGFAMAVGGGAGVAGALTGLGVAVYLVGPKVIEFGKQFIPVDEQAEALKGTIGQLKSRIDELKDKKILIPVEQSELDTALAKLKKLQDGLAAWEAARGTRSGAEKQSGAAVGDILAESKEGESAVVDRLTASRMKAAEKTNIPLREAIERQKGLEEELAHLESPASMMAAGMAGPGGGQAHAQQIQSVKDQIEAQRQAASKARENMKQETRAEVGTILKEAKEGSADQQKALARDLRASGQGDLATMVEQASPQAMRDKAKEEQFIERQRRNTRLDDALKKKAEDEKKKADDRLTDELNEMGKEIEHQTRQESPELFGNPVLVARAAEKAAPGQARKAAKEEDERFKEAANQVREKIPDIDRRVQEALLADRVRASRGRRPRNTAEAMGKQLIKEGVDKDLVATAVPELRMQGERKIGEAARKAMGAPGGEYEDVGRSQQFGVLDLATRTQAGVGGESKKQTTLQEQMVKYLQKLSDSGDNMLTVTIGP